MVSFIVEVEINSLQFGRNGFQASIFDLSFENLNIFENLLFNIQLADGIILHPE